MFRLVEWEPEPEDDRVSMFLDFGGQVFVRN